MAADPLSSRQGMPNPGGGRPTNGRLFGWLRRTNGSFARSSIVMVVSNGASAVLTAVAFVIIARRSGPTEFGNLTWFITGTTAIALVADVAGVYYSSSYLIATQDSGFGTATASGTILAYGFALGLLAGAVMGLVPAIRLVLFHDLNQSGWGALICCNVIGLTVLNQIQGLLLGQGRFVALAGLATARVGSFLVLVLAVGLPLRFNRALEFGILQLSATVFALAFVMPLVSRSGLSWPALGYLRACLAISKRAAVANWLSFLHLRIDQYLVDIILGPTALGLYGSVVALAEVLTRAPTMIGMVVFSRVASGADRRDLEAATIRRAFIVMACAAALAIIFGIFAPNILGLLYGERYVAGANVLRWLLPGIVFISGAVVLNNHAAGLGYPWALVVSFGGTLALNVALNLTLLHRMGLVGASLASSITYLIQLAAMWLYLTRRRSRSYEHRPGCHA